MTNIVIGAAQVYPLDATYDKSMSKLGARVKASFPISDLDGSVSAAVGDTLKIYEDWKLKFMGTITELTASEKKLSLTAHDSCYYLNKSKRIIQFSGMTVSEALAELWKQCGLACHRLPDMTASVDSVFYAQSPAEIARALIDIEETANGGEYYVNSENFTSIEVGVVGEDTCECELGIIINPSRQLSLDSVKNRISIIVSDGSGYTVTETASDNSSINKYGLLHDVVRVTSDASGIVGMAQHKLASTSQLLASGSVTVEGDWRLNAVGKRIRVREPLSGLDGEYVITAVSHKLGDDFKTTLSLQEYSPTKSIKPALEETDTDSLSKLSTSRNIYVKGIGELLNPFRQQKFRLTSRYGYRTHPITGQKMSFHGGIDLVVESSDKAVVSVADGYVVQSRIVTDKSDATWQWGNYIAIRGNDGAVIYYCHLASRAAKVGQTVKRGDVIGYQGSTGQSTGPHLHFEVRLRGETIDAAEYIGITNEIGMYEMPTVKPNSSADKLVDKLRK